MNKREEQYGGMMDGLTDRILGMVGFSKDHVEKIKTVLDMVDITEQAITVNISEKIKVIINRK